MRARIVGTSGGLVGWGMGFDVLTYRRGLRGGRWGLRMPLGRLGSCVDCVERLWCRASVVIVQSIGGILGLTLW